jgi:hypothetical protein
MLAQVEAIQAALSVVLLQLALALRTADQEQLGRKM